MASMGVEDPRERLENLETTGIQATLVCKVTKVTQALLETTGRLETKDCKATPVLSVPPDPKDPMASPEFLELLVNLEALDKMVALDGGDSMEFLAWM